MKMESYSRKCSGAGYLALENTCRDMGRPRPFFQAPEIFQRVQD